MDGTGASPVQNTLVQHGRGARATQMPDFLTFDLGTTLYKVALFGDTGKLLALERAIPPIDRPQSQWAEVECDAFVRVLVDAVVRLRASHDLNEVAAVCIATQANSFTLEDQHGRPMTPFILWSDQRAAELTEELRKTIPGGSHLLAIAKLLWLQKHQPDVVARARRMTFIGDYLAGGGVIEAGVASLARLFDPRLGETGRLLLQKLGIAELELPRVLGAGIEIGRFDRAEQLGLPRDCRMVMGCLDQYAGAIGTGTVEPGMICETTGTVLAAVRCADRLRDDLPTGVIQGPGFNADRFWQMSFSSSSANLLEWYRNALPGKPSFEELTRAAESAAPSDLMIEPFDDRGSLESSFRNVTASHTPGQIVRAIMMRVAQSLKKQVEDLSGDAKPAVIRSAGGAAKNDYWLQMKADVLGVPIEAMACEEPTSLGAAMLAARAMGLGTLREIASRWVRVRSRFEPRRIRS